MVANSPVVRQTTASGGRGVPPTKPNRLTSKSAQRAASSETGVIPHARVDCLKRQLSKSGYSPRVAQALSNAHRMSTRKLYDFQWSAFETYCTQQGITPISASLPEVADYLVHLRVTKKLKASSIATHMGAILSVLRQGRPQLDTSILRSVIKSYRNEVARSLSRPPEWDLSVVLSHLRSDHYEPLSEATRLSLTVKTLFLTAIASAARVSELHAIEASQVRFETRAGGSVTLGLVPTFVAKNQSSDERGRTFTIPSLQSLDGVSEEDLKLCPVRALRIYAERTKGSRGDRKRFFLPASLRSTKELDLRMLSCFIRTAILDAYKAAGLPPPARSNPHEVRAVSATMAYHANVSVADIMRGCF